MDTASRMDRPLRLAVSMLLPASCLFALLAGSAVYVLDRPWASAMFLAPLAAWQPESSVSFGWAGNSLPSLFHAYAFSLLIILALRPARHARLAGAVSWLLVATGLECLQAGAVQRLIEDGPGAIAAVPFADSFHLYIVNGRFDGIDLLATWLGVAIAYLASSVLEARP